MPRAVRARPGGGLTSTGSGPAFVAQPVVQVVPLRVKLFGEE